MLILTVPGLRNIIFEEKCFFGKYVSIFSKIFSGKSRSRDICFLKNRFRKNGVGVSLFGRGSGPENYSSDLPPGFKKTCLVTKRVAVGAMEIIPNDFCAMFQADADFEVKSAVASYFWPVFGHFLGGVHR